MATCKRDPRAVALAQSELELRRDVLTRSTLALSLHMAGRSAEAAAATDSIAAEQPADPRVLLHLGLIAASAGDSQVARQHLRAANTGRLALLPSECALLDEQLRSL